jgi:TM2 domain-containing membrane protein YozV
LNNIVARSGLTTEQQLIVNSELEKRRKSKGMAYLLWFFLGAFGGHRFYVGDIGIAIGMILVWIIGWFTFLSLRPFGSLLMHFCSANVLTSTTNKLNLKSSKKSKCSPQTVMWLNKLRPLWAFF